MEIPETINALDRLGAARFYHEKLGLAIHPLCPPDQGEDHSRGKKPIEKGWRKHSADGIATGYLERYFANGGGYNLGCVVRAPFVFIDLDSKSDQGESVRKWIEEQRPLQEIPREETPGGAHLVFICRDLPNSIGAMKKALSVKINNSVSAELYHDGLNIVLSPSVHKSGRPYRWVKTGQISEVTWDQLSQWFGFKEPESKKRGRPCKGKPWWGRYRGDLSTLDLVGVMRELDMLGEEISPEEGKWSVRCPWQSAH